MALVVVSGLCRVAVTATIGAEASYEYGDDQHFDDDHSDYDDHVNHEVTIMIIMMIMR